PICVVRMLLFLFCFFFFFQAEDGIRDGHVTGVQTCALPIFADGETALAFCIVPYVRGRERSLPVGEVLRQVEHAAAEGFREIVFLGQTVNAYRDGAVDFAELLVRANRVEGIARIRFTSPHPSDMSDRAIEAIAACEKVSPHVHLPLQSGSDSVLERMRRTYTMEEYGTLVGNIRRAVPGVALSTDIIVGF